MGFLAPAIGPAIGAIGSLFGSKAAAPGGVNQGQANQFAGQLQQNAGQMVANGQQQQQFGVDQQQIGANNMGQAGSYFQTLLNGNRANSTQLLAPQIQQQQEQFQRALQTGSQLMPRGGGRASTLFQMPGQQTSSLLGMYDQIRPQAAGQLAQIGQQQGAMGGQAAGLGLQGYAGANAGLGAGLQNALGANQQTMQNGAAIGNGISNILQPVNWAKVFGQKPAAGAQSGDGWTNLQFPGVG